LEGIRGWQVDRRAKSDRQVYRFAMHIVAGSGARPLRKLAAAARHAAPVSGPSDLSVIRSLSKDPRQDPPGPLHVRAIAVAKGRKHHRFFLADAKKKQRSKPDDARKTGDPIRQQHGLRDRP
jgi:hypothetical protein